MARAVGQLVDYLPQARATVETPSVRRLSQRTVLSALYTHGLLISSILLWNRPEVSHVAFQCHLRRYNLRLPSGSLQQVSATVRKSMRFLKKVL